MRSLMDLDSIQLDVLKEIGNIGSGNAATSLAKLLSLPIDMSTPTVKVMEVTEAANILGGMENVMIGILAKLSGDISGIMMFVIRKEFAQMILSSLLGKTEDFSNTLTELEFSAISEIGNILISSYISAIGTLSELQINTSVPALAIDMVGALLCVPAAEMGEVSDKVIFIQGEFINDQDAITANTLLVPTMESLDKLLTKLGITL